MDKISCDHVRVFMRMVWSKLILLAGWPLPTIQVFNSIYERHEWGSGEIGGEGSGMGSSMNYTIGVRHILNGFIRRKLI